MQFLSGAAIKTSRSFARRKYAFIFYISKKKEKIKENSKAIQGL